MLFCNRTASLLKRWTYSREHNRSNGEQRTRNNDYTVPACESSYPFLFVEINVQMNRKHSTVQRTTQDKNTVKCTWCNVHSMALSGMQWTIHIHSLVTHIHSLVMHIHSLVMHIHSLVMHIHSMVTQIVSLLTHIHFLVTHSIFHTPFSFFHFFNSDLKFFKHSHTNSLILNQSHWPSTQPTHTIYIATG